MNSISSSNVGAAFASGQLGLQNASNGITQAASNIAARTAESSQNVPSEARAAASSSPQNATSGAVPGNITDDLISLNVNNINAQASAKVLDTANDMLGTIIDTIA
jgi:phage-related protein